MGASWFAKNKQMAHNGLRERWLQRFSFVELFTSMTTPAFSYAGVVMHIYGRKVNGVRTDNIYKRFKDKEVLRGLSFEVGAGQIALLAGRNGAGKTTWLRIALGLARPSTGSVLYDGKLCTFARDKIAIVCDEPPVYPHLSGYENLIIMVGRADVVTSWSGYIKQALDLGPGFLKMKAKQYSLGQRRRLAIAGALLRKPKYLFLDEPTVGLDPVAWRMVMDSFKHLITEKQSTIILTGQDFDEIEKLVDKVIILKDGTAVFDGTLQEIKNRRLPKVRVSTLDYEAMLVRFQNAKLIDSSACSTIEISCRTTSEAEAIMQDIRDSSIEFQALSICTDSLEEAFLAIERAGENVEVAHATS